MTRWLPYAIVVAAWALIVAYAHPGLMSVDSYDQLIQGRTGQWGNWHPPILAALWGVLDRVVAGPLLMLLAQTALFAVGLFALARRYWPVRRAAIITAGMLVFPPVFVVIAGIWKDSLMASMLVCGIAGVLARSRIARAAGWLALVLAAALRHNALFVIVPLVAAIAPLPAWPTWRRRAAAVALGIAVAAAGALIDRALTRIDQHPFANQLALGDLAGTIAYGPDLTDDEVRALCAGTPLRPGDHVQQRLRARHLERASWELATSPEDDPVFDLALTDAHADALVAAWQRAIAAYPGGYVRFRLALFSRTIGWSGPKPGFTTPGEEPVELLRNIGEAHEYDGFQLAIARGLHAIRKWVIFSPLPYLALAASLLVVLWRDPLQRGLMIGALAYELTLIVLSPGGHDYRYVHWLAVVAIFGALVRLVPGYSATSHTVAANEPPNVPLTS